MVVSHISYFHLYLGKIPILTNIFQLGWFNHHLEMIQSIISIIYSWAGCLLLEKILSFKGNDVEKKTSHPYPIKIPPPIFEALEGNGNFEMGHDCRKSSPQNKSYPRIRELPGSPKNFPHCPLCHRKIWIEKWCRKAKDQNVSLECANCTTATKLTFLNSKFCFFLGERRVEKKTWVVPCWLDIR